MCIGLYSVYVSLCVTLVCICVFMFYYNIIPFPASRSLLEMGMGDGKCDLYGFVFNSSVISCVMLFSLLCDG